MKNKILWISIFIFVVLAAIFAFTDLQIMESVADPESRWAYYFEAYGQLPGMLVAFLGGNILLRSNKFKKTFKSISTGILLFILTTFMGAGFWGDVFLMQITKDFTQPFVLPLTLISIIVIQILYRRISDEKIEKLKPIGKVVVLLFIMAVFATVWGITFAWGRWTYRDMLEGKQVTSHYLHHGIYSKEIMDIIPLYLGIQLWLSLFFQLFYYSKKIRSTI